MGERRRQHTPPPDALVPAGQPLATAFSYRDDSSVPAFRDDLPLIVFDGVCVLCSGFARFVIARDRDEQFRFAHAQSALGKSLFEHYGLDPLEFETNLLIEKGFAYGRLEAFVRIVSRFGFPWSLARVASLPPPVVRNWLYERIARNRYGFFGKNDTCILPAGLSADRFLA